MPIEMYVYGQCCWGITTQASEQSEVGLVYTCMQVEYEGYLSVSICDRDMSIKEQGSVHRYMEMEVEVEVEVEAISTSWWVYNSVTLQFRQSTVIVCSGTL